MPQLIPELFDVSPEALLRKKRLADAGLHLDFLAGPGEGAHEWARDQADRAAQKYQGDKLPGGLGDNRPDSDFDQKQLAFGPRKG